MMTRPFPSARRRGTAIVEAAFVLPLCLLFLFAIYEYGRYVMLRQVLDNAAREGARYAVVNTLTKTTADVQNEVDLRLAGQGMHLQNYDKTTSIEVFKVDPATGSPLDANNNVVPWTQAPFTNAGFGQAIAVRITGTYTPVLPFLLDYRGGTLQIMSGTVSMQSTSIMYSEAN